MGLASHGHVEAPKNLATLMGNEEGGERPPKAKHVEEPEYESHCRMCKPTVTWRLIKEDGGGEHVIYDIVMRVKETIPDGEARYFSHYISKRYSELCELNDLVQQLWREPQALYFPPKVSWFGSTTDKKSCDARAAALQDYFCKISTEPIIFGGPNFHNLIEANEEFAFALSNAAYLINAKRRAYSHVLKKGKKKKKKEAKKKIKKEEKKQKHIEKQYQNTIQDNYEINVPESTAVSEEDES
eukprot:TRINITY_DN12075_c0_g1_i1.p1 TRINITY_DN12075_c0_g1~~TRINITY_DN12075_c0_g1_i1.p1  ORF type:complete len:242 (+),score=53.63 TRINITY_DN12075_c0_g1_i1:1-726(+)